MAGGRPRTSTPEPDEMIALGEEMIGWVKEHDPIHLSQWWRLEKHITSKVWDNMICAPEFSPYYEYALNLVGLKYLDKDGPVHHGISQRWLRVYFKDLKREEDETKQFESSLRLKEAQSVSQEEVDRANAVVDALNRMQSQFLLPESSPDTKP